MQASEANELLQAREQTYLFLTTAYRTEPSAESLAALTAALAAGSPVGDSQGYDLLRRWAAAARADLAQARSVLAAEFARLFLNAGGLDIHPFESVYTSPESMMQQEAYRRVLAALREEGVARVGDFKEPEDHLGVELEFMAYLCARSRQALQAGDQAGFGRYLARQADFLENHLLNWALRLADDVERGTTSDFYRALAQITREFLLGEPEDLAALATLFP